MSKKSVRPLVTDPDFGIRVPMFLTVYGHVIHIIGMNKLYETVLEPGKVLKYKHHGSYELAYTGEDHAVIKHTTLFGKIMYLFVPQRKWLAVSNGSFKVEDIHYESALIFWAALKVPAAATPGAFDQDLYNKYHTLFEGFNGYWKESFSESCQEDVDSYTFTFGARIRYGLVCVLQQQAIPADCEYEKLVREMDDWIDYREKPNYGTGD